MCRRGFVAHNTKNFSDSHMKLNAPQRVSHFPLCLQSSSGRGFQAVRSLLGNLKVCERIPNARQVSRFLLTWGGGGSMFSADLAFRAEQPASLFQQFGSSKGQF